MQVTLTHAVIRGRSVPHGQILQACCQSDEALAAQYQQITTELLPCLRAQTDAAYSRHIAAPARVDDRTIAGHGSMVAGPDPETQGVWRAWERLTAAYVDASEGRNPGFVPASRAVTATPEYLVVG